MRFAYQPSFLNTTRQLSHAQASKLLKAIERFQQAIEGRQWPQGLGITHLRDDYFEFRVGIQMRVIYRRTGDLTQYVLYGSHDQVRRFLERTRQGDSHPRDRHLGWSRANGVLTESAPPASSSSHHPQDRLDPTTRSPR